MKGLLRFCLGLSIAFEVVVAVFIKWLEAEGYADATSASPLDRTIAGLTSWTAPFALLAVVTIGVYMTVGRSWERMALPEKVLVAIPALAPLVVFRFMFIVIAGVLAATVLPVLLAVMAFIVSFGNDKTNIFGQPRGYRTSSVSLGSWCGDDRVHLGSDGRPARIGDESIQYGTDGRPAVIGGRKVTYGANGSMAWVGNERVQSGPDGSPVRIGNRRVR